MSTLAEETEELAVATNLRLADLYSQIAALELAISEIELGTASWETLTGKPSTFPPEVHSHAWDDITGKPTTFTPETHNHNDLYYTEAECDGLFSPLAGSTDIVTVGTIATGTWEGSAIAPAYLGTGSSIETKFLRGDGTWQAIAGGGDALVANPLSQFAATTSDQLRGVISNETGTGALVFATSPTLVTPALGTPSSGDLANCTFPTLNQSTTGNASTATTLETARTINGVSFNGSANITIGAAWLDLTGRPDFGTASEVEANQDLQTTDDVTFNQINADSIAGADWLGEIIGPTYLGTGSSISTKFLRGDGTWQDAGTPARVGFAASNSSTTIPATTWTKPTFVTEIEDTNSAWNGTTFTVPETGLYEVYGVFAFSSVTDGNVYVVGLAVNASNPTYQLGRGTAGGTGIAGAGGAVRVSLTAGDLVEMVVYCPNATSGFNTTPGYNTFSIYKM